MLGGLENVFSLMLEINASDNIYLSTFHEIRIWADDLSVINRYFTSHPKD